MTNRKNVNLVVSISINCMQIFILLGSKQKWALQLLLILICIYLINKMSNVIIENVSGFILLSSLFSFLDVLGVMSNLLGIICTGILLVYFVHIIRQK